MANKNRMNMTKFFTIIKTILAYLLIAVVVLTIAAADSFDNPLWILVIFGAVAFAWCYLDLGEAFDGVSPDEDAEGYNLNE